MGGFISPYSYKKERNEISMSRTVKCQICKKTIITEEAYRVTTINDKGKKINKYYCDSIELETYEQEIVNTKKEKENIFNTIDEILGYTCVNYNIISKELKPLIQVYSYSEIFNCFNVQKNKIAELIKMKDIDKEFNKIRYIFTVIINNIADDTNDLKNKIANQSIKKIKSEDIKMEDLPFSDYKYTEPKSTDFSSFF
jgi:hypothetical protein